MDFIQLYTATVERLGHEVQPDDGLSEADIDRREKALGMRLPDALRSYYRVAGRLDELNRSHEQLYTLEELEIEGDHLIFMEENQAVLLWGIRVSDLALPDPDVWQRLNEEPIEWSSWKTPLSYFLIFTLAWQSGLTNSEG